MGGHTGPKTYMGWWGDIGSPKQKYITTYSVSPYATKPLKGAAYNAVFNTFRRTKNQFLYVAIPAAIVWSVWANARDYNEYLYTKEGREELERVNV
ncbi:cytochrome b-c1 complex subunit 8 [Scheffersomyces xylosifermentans]|uniref:cytochrome b-c1 complex subunit 8 n=1 Tax=Scheffersomyces xylosifermentans TaxID=1304137 RepID=UPI00315C5B15